MTVAEALDDLRVIGRFDGKRIGSAEDQHVCARASVLLMALALDELRRDVQRDVIRILHYGGRHDETTQKRIVGEEKGLSPEVRRRGKEHMLWICADPQRKARALDRIREVLSTLDGGQTF